MTNLPTSQLLILALVTTSSAYNILGIFPTIYHSHYKSGSSLMKGLAAVGHNVTIISPFSQSPPLPNYRAIEIDGMMEEINRLFPLPDVEPEKMEEWPYYRILEAVSYIGIVSSNFTLQHNAVKHFLNSTNEQFDVVIIESIFSESLLGFGQHFNAPVIGYSSMFASKWTSDMVGTPMPLSYVPHPFLSYTNKMSFTNRIGNVIAAVMDYIWVDWIHMSSHVKIYESVFAGPNLPRLQTLQKNVSLMLLNSHTSYNYAQPYAANMIDVGGLHLNKEDFKPLPDDLQLYLDNATDGVIYFSLGSIVDSNMLVASIRDGMLQTFSKLKQKVIWKWDKPDLPGKPENVLIRTWLPQNDILTHPNVRLFISHGGLLSSIEAVYNGVPVLGLPFFADQQLNMARAVDKGYALSLTFSNLTETSFTWAINELLNNDRYANEANKISAIYHDQPMSPLQTAIYWVEYIVRHRGAAHLHSVAQDLTTITLYNIDVYAFFLFIAVAAVAILRYVALWVFGSKPEPSKKLKSS